MLPERKSSLDIAELPADRRQLGLALRLAFPEILFLRPLDFTPPEEPALTFVESLDDPLVLHRGAEAWLSPPADWQPLWMPEGPGGRGVTCINRPPFWVRLGGVSPIFKSIQWRPLRDDPDREAAVEIETIGSSLHYATWRGDDPERARFVRKVFRIAKKGATNSLLGIDLATGRPRFGPTKGGLWWIATHAAAWLREAPNRFLDDDVRPGDEAGSYDWPLPTGEEGGRVRRRVQT